MSNIVVTNIGTGFENDREAFIIDNDAFPVLNNAYVFRGKVLRKEGSRLLGRLQRDFEEHTAAGNDVQIIGQTDGSGDFTTSPDTIFTILGLEDTSSITIGSLFITVGGTVFEEPAIADGTLEGDPSGSGTINYQTGLLTLTGAPANEDVVIEFSYFPGLPVMGLEDFLRGIEFPDLVAFDTRYSYQIIQQPEQFYDVTFYKETGLPFMWHGEDYQQFYSTSYHNSLWVTNGVPGFHFSTIIGQIADQTSSVITMTLSRDDLEIDDYLFFNELQGATIEGINGVTGFISDNASAPTYEITFPATVTIATHTSGTGLAQLLTNSTANVDGIRYYTGDPTVSLENGWVNFSPPLSEFHPSLNPTPQYLIGADLILPFKDRQIFWGVWFGRPNEQQYFPNRILYSQNGTPYYHALVPEGETFQANAYFTNVPAKGGFLGAPVQQKIVSANYEEDVVIVGFTNSQRKLISTGDDSFPFVFQTITADFGNLHTYSSITLDRNILFIGNYGIASVNQNSLSRIDQKIPDEFFQISFIDNDEKRVTAIRDVRGQFIYFTVPLKSRPTSTFPSRTYSFNYFEGNWSTHDENYTHYGYYSRRDSYTWATLPYRTWSEWLRPWNFGGIGERFPQIIGGNQQGFVLEIDVGVLEGFSNFISSINGDEITSENHCMNEGDYIRISGIIGTTGEELNGTIQRVRNITKDTFLIDTISSGTYLGGGVFQRIPNMDIRTKMFPLFWPDGRKSRISTHRYLLDNAPEGQVTVDIYTSQNDTFFANDPDSQTWIPFTNVLLTGPEPENNEQPSQRQIWHRMNTSLVGDSVQIGFRFSDEQMRNETINDTQFALNALVITFHPSGVI